MSEIVRCTKCGWKGEEWKLTIVGCPNCKTDECLIDGPIIKVGIEQFLAKSCSFAQEHVGDKEVWPMDDATREQFFQCTSFQVACFLAQNTVRGREGVEWNVVIDQLVDTDPPVKTEEQWQTIIANLAKGLGGWNDPGNNV